MLRVDLGQLGREGSVVAEARISEDDPLWDEANLTWTRHVEVRLRATLAGTGEVIARGSVSGKLRQECRRCLQPVETEFSSDLTLVFVSDPGGGQDDEDEGGAYRFEATGAELDMSSAVREEVVLAVNPYVVCDPDCQGLCAACGANLNHGACGCAVDERDPRWIALRKLKDD